MHSPDPSILAISAVAASRLSAEIMLMTTHCCRGNLRRRHQGSAAPIDQMHSGAGGTPQRDVDAVVRHVVCEPDLNVLASSGAAIEHGGHYPGAVQCAGRIHFLVRIINANTTTNVSVALLKKRRARPDAWSVMGRSPASRGGPAGWHRLDTRARTRRPWGPASRPTDLICGTFSVQSDV